MAASQPPVTPSPVHSGSCSLVNGMAMSPDRRREEPVRQQRDAVDGDGHEPDERRLLVNGE